MGWIYVIIGKYWKVLCEYLKKNDILTSLYQYELKKGDKILLYNKKLNGGFCGIATASDVMEKKIVKNKIIFDDKNMEKYFVKIDNEKIFKKNYGLKEITDKMESYISRKYFTGNVIFVKIDDKLLERILLTIESLELNIQKKVKKTKKTKKTKNLKEEKEEKKEIIEEHILHDQHVQHVQHVPIFIKPCSNFIFTNKTDDIIEMFKRHYGCCDKCEVVNNNNEELSRYLEKEIEYCEVGGTKCDEVIKDYLTCNKQVNHKIIINRIMDGIYYNCLIINW